MKNKYILVILLLLIVPTGLTVFIFQNQTTIDQHNVSAQQEDEPIQPSNPTNVVIKEEAIYDAPVGDDRPIVHFYAVIYWEELAGAGLNFYINTSDVITAEFQDYETKEPLQERDSCVGQISFRTNCYEDRGDRYLIVPGGRSFEYEIDAYYDPDIVEDTGFIVVFNSQTVDFSLEVDGETRYAKVDYSNHIVLPKGAGIVSFAPNDKGFQGYELVEEDRYGLSWEYIDRQMDSKHNPLMISVTYAFDEIFLAFTEQVYQNQVEQRERQEEENRLNLLNQSFAIIATMAIVASIFSILFAYLLARRKFEPQLQRAKELPKREASDIEKSSSLQVPVKSMFLSAMILLPMFFSPIPMVDGQIAQDETIKWDGYYDLEKDPLVLTEYIAMELPVQRDTIYVYANTSASEFSIFDNNGIELPYDTEDNRYVIDNPGFEFNYELRRPYEVHNNSNMLVFLDRFWLEFLKPPELQEDDDRFFHVDLQYSLILPEGAEIYSASPSDLLTVDRTTHPGRVNVTFNDQDRQMDAFHDVFETQVTFSFINILDALENLDSDFVQIRAETQDLESLVELAATEILLFSLLGLIAPLISFFIAYWVFRRKYKKEIERAEKEQEEKIFVEEPQIQALTQAVSKDAPDKLFEAYKGHYFRLIDKISDKINRDASRLEDSIILRELQRNDLKIDYNEIIQLINMGQSIQPEDAIGYDQVLDYAKQVEELVNDL